MENEDLIALTADIVSAHVANNRVPTDDVARLVQGVHAALAGLGEAPEEEAKVPVVSVRASVRPEHLICMECGKKVKMLKRHLQTAHGMTPEDYRQDYGLPDTYPLVAPNYAEKRSELAKAAGLGRKPGPKAKGTGEGRRSSGKKSNEAEAQG